MIGVGSGAGFIKTPENMPDLIPDVIKVTMKR